MKNKIIKYISFHFNDTQVFELNPKDIIFEERVKLKCFYCKHYNNKWTCPSKIPSVDYEKIIRSEYTNALVLCYTAQIDEKNFEEIRSKTTNILHKTLLETEKFLYENNHTLATSFIGGSCKLCKNGCNPEKCSNPMLARIPMEAVGINVIETMKKLNIEIKFPITDSISRYGLLLWEDK